MALRWRTRTNHVCLHMKANDKSQKWTRLLIIDSQVKNTRMAVLSPKGFVITNAPMASNDILPSIPWVAVFSLHCTWVCPTIRLNWAVEQLPRLLSYQARQSAKDHHFARPRVSRTNYPAPATNLSPDYDEDCTHCRAICHSIVHPACQMDQFEPEFQHLDYLICIQTDFGITSFKSLASALPLSVDQSKKSSCRQRSEFARPQCSLQSHRQVANVSPHDTREHPRSRSNQHHMVKSIC